MEQYIDKSDKEYWYLREGDFLPEPIDSICKSWKKSRHSIVEFLSASANIFTSREDAEEASHVVRAALIAYRPDGKNVIFVKGEK